MSEYKKLLKQSNIDKPELIEIYVNYYGEQYREQIQKRINEIKIGFYIENEVEFIVKRTLEKKYKNYPTINWEDKVSEIMQVLNNLADYKSLDIQQGNKTIKGENVLARESNILKKFGLNYKKILRKKENGEFEIIETYETKRLRNYIRGLDKSKDNIVSPVHNGSYIENNIIPLYNYSVETKKLYADDNVSTNTRKEVFNTVTNPMVEKEYKGEFFKISKDLTEKEVTFINDLIMLKTSPDEWTDSFTNYIINGANNLFDQNFSTKEEVVKNLEILLDYTNREKSYFKEIIQYNSANLSASKYSQNDDLIFVMEKSSEDTTKASYQGKHDVVIIKPDTYNFMDILHEFNHGLGANTFRVHGARRSGFHNLLEGSEEFNEIVNEFLTIRIREKYENSTIDYGSEEFINANNYRSGVQFFEKFLKNFEDKLKECQMGDAEKILKDFIGEKNYDTLLILSGILGSMSYGKVFLDENGNIADTGKITTALDFVNAYKQGKLKEIEKNGTVANYLELLLTADKFLQDLIEHHAEFKKGNIVDIKLKKFNLLEKENVQNQNVQNAASV